MKNRFCINLMLGALWLAGGPAALRAQSFSVPWFVVADGGGTTAAGLFSLTGTFGQWEANEQPLTNGLFSLSGGFWSFLANDQTTLFSDNFSGNFVDPSKWTTSGNTVLETNGIMEVLNTVIDNGGVLTSVPFSVNSTGLITIERQVLVHAQPSPDTNYPGTYFMGQFGISIGALAPFSVYYADMDYGDGVTYMARHGFFLARDGQSPFLIADQTNVSPAITPLWDTWFYETVTYDPVSGNMEYFINNVSQGTFNVGALPPTNSPTMTLSFNAWGWWTGHEQLFEDLLVTQAASVPNSLPMIALSGNLAFGGVAIGTTSNQTLTISNVGNSTLTITNITYPAGYSGNWPGGSITNGGSTNVTVTFSPTATTNYSGMLTINSDAVSGLGAVLVSGFGASGTLTLTIDIHGKGIVTPNLNGRLLTEGARYTLRAVAGSGQVFSNWTGSILTNKNPLTFIMQSNTLLQANFVPSPFLPVTGTYNGLFAPTNGVTVETAGMLNGLLVGPRGGYSGTLLINGGRYTISGSLNLSGQGSNTVLRAATRGGPFASEFTVDWNISPPQVTGTISGTNAGVPWLANLIAYRSTNSATARYTMLLAPTEFGLPGVPLGYGYFLMTTHAGILGLSGALADGTPAHQAVRVNEMGEAPLYISLYGNTGLLMGWVNMADGAPAGTLNWIKKAARSGLYTNGFTNLVIAEGGGWTNRSPAAAITLPAGQLNLSGGALLSPISLPVALSDNNALTITTNNPTNSLTGSINPATGLLTITFGNGNGRATTVGKGAVLQNTTNAAGYFLGKTNAGSVILQP